MVALALAVPIGNSRVSVAEAQDPPALSVADVTVGEGDGAAVLTITMDSPSSSDVTVDYPTSDETATEPDDYTETVGVATIPAGATSTTASVPILDDAASELDEAFTISLSNPSDGAIIDPGAGSATVTIIDNEPQPSVLSIGNVTVGEADGQAVITITLEPVSTSDVTFQYDTSDGTAVAGQDYTAVVAATLTIPAGDTSVVSTIAIIDDGLDESDETITVTLSNPSQGAVIGQNPGTATVTIIDNDLAADITSVVVTVSSITAHKAGTGGFAVVVQGPISFDLLDVGGVEAVLGSAVLTTGLYTQIRLIVDSVVVTRAGIESIATVPGGVIKLVDANIPVDIGFNTILTSTSTLTTQ